MSTQREVIYISNQRVDVYRQVEKMFNCTTCHYENTDMQCDHPDRDKKGFADKSERHCWKRKKKVVKKAGTK